MESPEKVNKLILREKIVNASSVQNLYSRNIQGIQKIVFRIQNAGISKNSKNTCGIHILR